MLLKFHSSNLPTKDQPKYLSLTPQNPKAAVDFDPELPYVNLCLIVGKEKQNQTPHSILLVSDLRLKIYKSPNKGKAKIKSTLESGERERWR